MGDTAWVEYNWHFDAKIKADGMETHSDGRESEVFRKIDGGWAGPSVPHSIAWIGQVTAKAEGADVMRRSGP